MAAQDKRTTLALDAYSAGVNAWITQVNWVRAAGCAGVLLFLNEIAAWSPADSIAILKLMAVQLSSRMQDEVLRAHEDVSDLARRAACRHSARRSWSGRSRPARLRQPDAGAVPVATTRMAYVDTPLSPFHNRDFAGASNAWAATPDKAA